MSGRSAPSPRSMAMAALQRERVTVEVAHKGIAIRLSLPMPQLALQAGAGGITHLVDGNTGERLGCAIDATVLERTRLFFAP